MNKLSVGLLLHNPFISFVSTAGVYMLVSHQSLEGTRGLTCVVRTLRVVEIVHGRAEGNRQLGQNMHSGSKRHTAIFIRAAMVNIAMTQQMRVNTDSQA